MDSSSLRDVVSDEFLQACVTEMDEECVTARLYQETFAIMRDALQPMHREVAEQTSQIVEEALNVL